MAMVFALVKDLFFRTKIQESGKRAKKKIEFVDSLETAQGELVIVDLEDFPREDVKTFKEKNSESMVVGYLSHKQTGLREKALNEGFDLVLVRSEFVKRLGELLKG